MRSHPKPKPGYSHLYMIGCHEFQKIGVTDNIGSRIELLQLGNPYPLGLIEYRAIKSRHVRLAERDAHEMLAEFALGREWFKAPAAVVKRALDLALRESRRREQEQRAWIAASEQAYATRGISVEYSDRRIANDLRTIRKENKNRMLDRLKGMAK